MEDKQTDDSHPTNNQYDILDIVDPNLTISDESDEINDIPKETNEKRKGRWSKKEHTDFLRYIVDTKSDLIYLQKHIPSRTMQHIKAHKQMFIQKCKKEFSVSKTKQQNKNILRRICISSGLHVTDSYLSKLETIILDPSFDDEILLDDYDEDQSRQSLKANKRHLHQKKPSKIKKNSITKSEQRQFEPKAQIFNISKTERNTKVYNILTINVVTNHQSHIEDKKKLTSNNSKPYGFDPFNIEFDPEIFNMGNMNSKTILNKPKNLYENIELNNLDSSINDEYESIN